MVNLRIIIFFASFIISLIFLNLLIHQNLPRTKLISRPHLAVLTISQSNLHFALIFVSELYFASRYFLFLSSYFQEALSWSI